MPYKTLRIARSEQPKALKAFFTTEENRKHAHPLTGNLCYRNLPGFIYADLKAHQTIIVPRCAVNTDHSRTR